MPVSWRISRGVVFLESERQVTLHEWTSAVDGSLASDGYRRGMGVVQDWRSTKGLPAARVIRLRIDVLVERARARGVNRWAIVVAGDARWEIVVTGDACRATAQASPPFAGRSSVEFRVFKDLAEAEAWARMDSSA
jgi:hypothetical protein